MSRRAELRRQARAAAKTGTPPTTDPTTSAGTQADGYGDATAALDVTPAAPRNAPRPSLPADPSALLDESG